MRVTWLWPPCSTPKLVGFPVTILWFSCSNLVVHFSALDATGPLSTNFLWWHLVASLLAETSRVQTCAWIVVSCVLLLGGEKGWPMRFSSWDSTSSLYRAFSSRPSGLVNIVVGFVFFVLQFVKCVLFYSGR